MKIFFDMHIAKRSALAARQAGFSLMEVTIAIGIVSFALLTIFGLIPVGLEAINSATYSTVQSDIMKTIYSQLDSTPFIAKDVRGEIYSPLEKFAGNEAGRGFPLFFDIDGGEVSGTSPKVVFIADVLLEDPEEIGDSGFEEDNVAKDRPELAKFRRGRIFIGRNVTPNINATQNQPNVIVRPFILVNKGF